LVSWALGAYHYHRVIRPYSLSFIDIRELGLLEDEIEALNQLDRHLVIKRRLEAHVNTAR
jgi:hypothetical protein